MLYTSTGETIESALTIKNAEISKVFDAAGLHVWSPELTEKRTLVFEDSFGSDRLDAAAWDYEIGYIRNQELQYYRTENVSLEDGLLVITAKHEPYGGYDWTSGSILTRGLKEFSRGRWSAKIKLPNVIGAFPAFWMRGNPSSVGETGIYWPRCGEIDIMEQMPGNGKTVSANLWQYSGGSFGSRKSHKLDTSDWHIYSLEWDDEKLAFFVDGVPIGEYVFDELDQAEIIAYKTYPFFLQLNLAVGSAGGEPAENTSEMKMYVDWVRIYAAK